VEITSEAMIPSLCVFCMQSI